MKQPASFLSSIRLYLQGEQWWEVSGQTVSVTFSKAQEFVSVLHAVQTSNTTASKPPCSCSILANHQSSTIPHPDKQQITQSTLKALNDYVVLKPLCLPQKNNLGISLSSRKDIIPKRKQLFIRSRDAQRQPSFSHRLFLSNNAKKSMKRKCHN